MTIYSKTDLIDFSIKELVAHYNELTGSSIKAFQNKAVAVRRTMEAQENYMDNQDNTPKRTPKSEIKLELGGSVPREASTAGHAARLVEDGDAVTWEELAEQLMSHERPNGKPMTKAIVNRRIKKMIEADVLVVKS